MIWCVSFAEIEAFLESAGYRRVRTVDGNVLFLKGRRPFTIREPNIHGELPENIVLDAFSAARIEPPGFTVRFSD